MVSKSRSEPIFGIALDCDLILLVPGDSGAGLNHWVQGSPLPGVTLPALCANFENVLGW